MAKRISDIAKELGIQSKAIIEKCLAEGVPSDKVKGHMSTVSAGLEASIREWFTTEASMVTAVETTEHVSIDKVKASPRRRPARMAGAKGDEGGADASLIDSPMELHAEPIATPAGDKPAAPMPHKVDVPPRHEPVVAAPAEVATPEAPAAPVVEHVVVEPSPPPLPPAPVKRPVAVTAPPVSRPHWEREVDEAVAAAPQKAVHMPEVPAVAAHPTDHPRHGSHGAPGSPVQAGPPSGPKVIRPAPMNVPTRPTVVSPAGKKLEIRTPVKLSGPKVVRIEAPEVVNVPRARRDGPGMDGPGRGGFPGGGGGGAGAGGEDDGRSPRRKKRPAPAAAAPQAGAGVPARRKGRSDEAAGGMWREQDLLEREARLQRAGGFLKKRRHELKLRTAGSGERSQMAAVTGGVVRISAPFTIKDLSAATGVKGADIVKKLFMQGIMATINSGIDAAKAQEIMIDFNIELEVEESKSAEQVVSDTFVDRKTMDERSRGPVVTILGHVDHGKTSLLDKIRNANVAAGEAGGITQATSAFRVPVKIGGEEKHIVFLDTPGHKAFTEMRARGASLTDVVVLVVSAPEGVAPQTIESINHAKAAKVPIVVALNKIDRPDATEARINQTLSQLAEQGLNPVEWGGQTEVVKTSATKGTGIEQLLEILDLQGQMLDLKADFGGAARGTVIESRMEEGRGAVANVLVQDGQLNVGDFVVIGRAYGRIRDMMDDRGVRHKSIGPGNPVQISGFDMLPDAGDKFYIVDSVRKGQEAAEQRRDRERHDALAQPKVTLDTLFSQMATSAVKEIVIVLKADVQGSVDVLKNEIESIKTTEVKARVIHSAVGGINESDVLLADASKAIIVGFNVIASGKARSLAESKGVEIRTYEVIYDLTDDIKKAAEGLLAPEMKHEILGHAEVRKVFKVSKVGTIAGCYITDGTVERDALIRVTRNGIVIENGRKLEQLKRVKDDAREVRAGMECGMKIVGYDDIREGDVLECYKQVEVKRKL